MRRALVGMLAVAAAAFAAPSAQASPANYQVIGGCFFVGSTSSAVTGGQGSTTGFVGGAGASTANGVPAASTVTCQIRVNGIARSTAPYPTSTGVFAGAWPASYSAADDDLVQMCRQTVYANGVVLPWQCNALTTTPVLPEPVCNLLTGLGLPGDVVCGLGNTVAYFDDL